MAGRVLVVEDQPLNMELAVAILENNGYEVWTASDAKECLTVLQKDRPDIILMDIQLPGTDGLELTRMLRADPATQDLLIVAMTAHAMEEDAARVRAAGCDGYLIKPIQTRLLAQQITGFLAQKTGAASQTMPESMMHTE
ncbi:MAG: response regulator [Chloroflexota bacterium]